MKLFVGVTDRGWYDHLRAIHPDDVNFWRPSGANFRALSPGDPFLFKLHAPWNAIVGGGFFVESIRMPVSQAWMAFERRNGVEDLDEFMTRIDRYRRKRTDDRSADPMIGSIMLTQPFFFDEPEWLPAPSDWQHNIVSGKGYDATHGVGRELWTAVTTRLAVTAAVDAPDITSTPEERKRWVRERLGQGAFRTLVTEAYGRRCAVTGERTLPVLEAAHIKPYARQGPNRVDNGLLLRSDLHRLFDRGLVTIEPDTMRFHVSDRIRAEYANGREYYAMDGRPLIVLPPGIEQRPNREFLAYHRAAVFRP